MGAWIIDRLKGADGAPLLLELALGYIVVKIVIKAICRKVVGTEANLLEVAAWFGVDAAVLALTFSAGFGVPEKCHFTRNGAIVWYGVMVSMLLLAVLSYVGHLAWRKQQCSRWLKATKLAGTLAFAVLFGVTPLLGTLSVLEEIAKNEERLVGSGETGSR